MWSGASFFAIYRHTFGNACNNYVVYTYISPTTDTHSSSYDPHSNRYHCPGSHRSSVLHSNWTVCRHCGTDSVVSRIHTPFPLLTLGTFVSYDLTNLSSARLKPKVNYWIQVRVFIQDTPPAAAWDSWVIKFGASMWSHTRHSDLFVEWVANDG